MTPQAFPGWVRLGVKAAVRHRSTDPSLSSSEWPLVGVEVRWSPDLMLAVATGRLEVPREVDGVPVILSERTGGFNRPHQRYMASFMCLVEDPNPNAHRPVRPSVGASVLSPEISWPTP